MQKKDRKEAIKIVIERSMTDQLMRSQQGNNITLESIIYDTIFQEKKRISSKKNSRKVYNEKTFWATQEKRFYAKEINNEVILKDIIEHFADEIAGGYNEKIYNIIIRILPFFLRFTLSNNPFWKFFSKKKKVVDLVQIQGPIDKIKKLSENTTLIVTPTHLSNFDSIVVGYATNSIGIPPLVYGAGLNLFKNPILSFLMNNLGAYKVDREKKNELYKAVLKNYAAVTLQFGYHNLFYPGGTRSKSAKIEEHLKYGLLGSGLTSYIESLKQGQEKKVVIVPCTINYGLCLEAKSLIRDYMKEQAGELIVLPKRANSKSGGFFDFATKMIRLDSKISVCFGTPIDIFGNDVNENGDSFDKNGRKIVISKYVTNNGVVEYSIQRDRTYTGILGKRILKSFFRNNMAMETHLVAYAFIYVAEERYKLPVLKLMPLNEIRIHRENLLNTIEFLKNKLIERVNLGNIKTDELIAQGTNEEILNSALKQFASYYGKDILFQHKETFFSKDLLTLFYYRNRLTSYGLDKDLSTWKNQI